MSRRASRVLIAFLIFALAACSRPPAPDEIATPDEDVIAFVRRHEAAISEEGLPRHQAALEATLLEVGRRYGTHSSQFVQAHTEAAIMVYEAAGAENSVGFFREWLRVSEAVYGHDHRETAFALNDYGRSRILAAGGQDPESLVWLRKGLGVRRRVLGNGHMETAASEGFIAEELIASCELSAHCPPGDARLVEAEALARHAYDVYAKGHAPGHHETNQMEALLGRIRARNGQSADIFEGGHSRKPSGTPTR
jgi:hypothetical protein